MPTPRRTINLMASNPVEVIVGLGHIWVNDLDGCILHVYQAKSVVIRYDGEIDVIGDLTPDPISN